MERDGFAIARQSNASFEFAEAVRSDSTRVRQVQIAAQDPVVAYTSEEFALRLASALLHWD